MTDQVTPVGLVWGEVEERLNGYTCLWQDLDGLHVTGPPQSAPPTSILWAWPTGASAMSEPPAPFDEWDPQHSLVGDESAPAGSQPGWAWEPAIVEFDPPLLRIRIDGDHVFLAQCVSGTVAPAIPWGDERQIDGLYVAADTRAADESADAAADRMRKLKWCEVREPIPVDGAQPVSFILPATLEGL